MRQYARTGGRRGTVRLLPASNVPSTGRHGLRLFWIGLLGAALVSIAGCTSSPAGGALPSNSIRPMTSEEGVAACQGSDLDVSVDSADLSIRVKNASSEDCSLTGSPPASMKLGRVDGPSPEQTTVVVPAGRVYVQPQVQVEGVTACPTPWPSGAPRTGHWTVQVQGDTFHPPGPGQLMVNVVNCFAYTLPQGFLAP